MIRGCGFTSVMYVTVTSMHVIGNGHKLSKALGPFGQQASKAKSLFVEAISIRRSLSALISASPWRAYQSSVALARTEWKDFIVQAL